MPTLSCGPCLATAIDVSSGGQLQASSSIFAVGQVSLADGTSLAAEKLARVLSNDPATGILRHADAGYELADQIACSHGIRVPMQEG